MSEGWEGTSDSECPPTAFMASLALNPLPDSEAGTLSLLDLGDLRLRKVKQLVQGTQLLSAHPSAPSDSGAWSLLRR